MLLSCKLGKDPHGGSMLKTYGTLPPKPPAWQVTESRNRLRFGVLAAFLVAALPMAFVWFISLVREPISPFHFY